MNKWEREAQEREQRKEELKEWGAKLEAEAKQRREERRREEAAQKAANLMRLRLKEAEREAEGQKFAERQKWTATGKHPADFEAAWPRIRQGLARAAVARRLNVSPEELAVPEEAEASSPAGDQSEALEAVRKDIRRRIRRRF